LNVGAMARASRRFHLGQRSLQAWVADRAFAPHKPGSNHNFATADRNAALHRL
jgi:hypothetical protein